MHLTLILGPMFSGKSSAAIQRIRRAQILGWKTLSITSNIDTRYDTSGCHIVTHDKTSVEALGVKVLEGVCDGEEYKNARLIVIEEAQFFTGLYDFVVKAVESHGKDVVVVGLDGDSDRKPFGDILELIPLADEIVRLNALCKRCGDGTSALFTALVCGVKTGQICVGGDKMYQPLCRRHFLENEQKKREGI